MLALTSLVRHLELCALLTLGENLSRPVGVECYFSSRLVARIVQTPFGLHRTSLEPPHLVGLLVLEFVLARYAVAGPTFHERLRQQPKQIHLLALCCD